MTLRIRPITIVLAATLAFFQASGAYGRQPIVPNVRSNYREAFNAINNGQYQVAQSLVNHGADPVLNKVLKGYLMALPGNSYSFDDLSEFISDHPDWPGLSGIIMIAEQKIPQGAADQQVVNWFTAHPPLTTAGFYRYIDSLSALGQDQKAVSLIRDRWINKDLSSDDVIAFHARYARVLTPKDHKDRLDRLLWDNNISAARALYPLLDSGIQAVAEARIALANQSSQADTLVDRVPSHLLSDPGLLYERLRWRRKNDMDDSALEILKQAPTDLGNAEAWWNERHIMIRRIMDSRNFALAYKLAASHGMKSGFGFIQAEFMAGWLALRFLNRPEIAQEHFSNMLQIAATPISRARGAYWLGRAYEALGDSLSAQQAYETAASLYTTFYGQLAITRLYEDPTIKAQPEPSIPPTIRSRFFARDSVRAVERLYQIGQTDRARVFFKAITNNADKRVEFALLMELAYQLQRPDWAINAAKAAAQKNMLIGAGAFPVLSTKIPTPPDLAFTHALIRQESLFNSDATSPAGARGLMQLMPRTAKDVAKKLDVRFKETRLSEPDYNLRLGTAFITEKLGQFDGSYILALAGYNAGPRRCHEWIEKFGDPRSPQVDPIDWIEMIPIYETRNYIHRIIENLQFYRARLNGGQAPLQIMNDLRR